MRRERGSSNRSFEHCQRRVHVFYVRGEGKKGERGEMIGSNTFYAIGGEERYSQKGGGKRDNQLPISFSWEGKKDLRSEKSYPFQNLSFQKGKKMGEWPIKKRWFLSSLKPFIPGSKPSRLGKRKKVPLLGGGRNQKKKKVVNCRRDAKEGLSPLRKDHKEDWGGRAAERKGNSKFTGGIPPPDQGHFFARRGGRS